MFATLDSKIWMTVTGLFFDFAFVEGDVKELRSRLERLREDDVRTGNFNLRCYQVVKPLS